MKLEQSFEVQAPIDVVWEALIDLERVAPCLPGATITGHDEDGTYHGEFKVKLGPTTASYRGTVKIEEADEATHRATHEGQGDRQARPGRRQRDDRQHAHRADGGTTRVEAVTDFTITGRLARFGRGGMIEDISNRLMRDFSSCLAEPDRGRARHRAARRSRPARRHPRPSPPPPRRPAGRPPRLRPRRPPPPPPTPAKPISGFSLFFGALWDRIGRLFGRRRQRK